MRSAALTLLLAATMASLLGCRQQVMYTHEEANSAYETIRREGFPPKASDGFRKFNWTGSYLYMEEWELVRAYQNDREEANRVFGGETVFLMVYDSFPGVGAADSALYVDFPLSEREDTVSGVVRCYMPSFTDFYPFTGSTTRRDFLSNTVYLRGTINVIYGIVMEHENRNPEVIEVLGCLVPEWWVESRNRLMQQIR